MNIKGNSFLVVGGAGFVGSHIVEQLLAEGAAQVRVLDNLCRGTPANLAAVRSDPRLQLIEGDMRDAPALRRAMEGADGVFLLAALWLGECFNDPRAAHEVNTGGTLNVLEAVRDLKVKRVVYSSSASVYGDAVQTPMTEEHPFNNRTMYGATKIACEQYFRAFHDTYKTDYVALRYMNIYGPRMDDKGTYVSVIMKVLDRIAAGNPPIIHGDGSQAYDFIHVQDVARCNLLAMKADCTDEAFNVGTGTRTTIREIVDRLLRLTGSRLQPNYEPQTRVFVTNRVGSTQKAQRMLGFSATIGVDEGLRTVVDWKARRDGSTAAATPGLRHA